MATVNVNKRQGGGFGLQHWPLLHGLVILAALSISDSTWMGWLRHIGLAFATIGVCANLFVIWANRGRMPAKDDTIPPEVQGKYEIIDNQTKFAFLGDWIPFRDWLISPGDLCLWFGLAIVLFDRLGRTLLG